MPATVVVETAAGLGPERRYAAEVVFEELLGLKVVHVPGSGPDTCVRLADDPHGRVLRMPDGLFASGEAAWLTPATLPARPLARWEPPAELAGLYAGALPILYGQPLAGSYWHEEPTGLYLGLDVLGSAFFMLTRYEELVLSVRDRHGRFPAAASLAAQENFLDTPIVNVYVELLWQAMRGLWPGLARKPRQFRVLLSHDVDLPRFSHLKQCPRLILADLLTRRDLPLALEHLGAFVRARCGCSCRDPFNSFDFLMAESERHGWRSAFYFIPARTGGLKDGDYSLEDPFIQALLSRIDARGHEIGLHGSYGSYRDAGQTAREAERLQAVLAGLGIFRERLGGRQHYLRWEAAVTWQNWEDAGLAYDASLGFPERPGFRSGLCDAYPAFNPLLRRRLKLVEQPLHVMETTLLVYQGLGLAQALEQVRAIARTCRRFEGSFSLLWHNNALWSAQQRATYRAALEALAGLGSGWSGGASAQHERLVKPFGHPAA